MLIGLCGVGFTASLAALLIGFVPPSQFGSGGSAATWRSSPAGRSAWACWLPYLFYRLRKPSWKLPAAPDAAGAVGGAAA